MTQKEFVEAVERYLSETGISASQFGKAVCGDPSFVLELRRGRDPRLSLVSRALAFMAANRPTTQDTEAAA